MRKLSKTQSAVMVAGGAMMVVSAVCFVLLWQQRAVCWTFLAGATMFAVVQMMQTYDGNNFVARRLKRIMDLANLLFVVAGLLMVDTAYQFMRNIFSNYEGYYNWLYNKWVVVLLIAALLEIYTMLRMDQELKNERKDD